MIIKAETGARKRLLCGFCLVADLMESPVLFRACRSLSYMLTMKQQGMTAIMDRQIEQRKQRE